MKETFDRDTSFSHVPTAEELAEVYRQSKKADPTSVEYERILIRPKLHLARAVTCSLAAVIVSVLTAIIIHLISHRLLFAVLGGIATMILTVLIFARRIFIWLVKAYQHFAPAKVRNRCRFEPSCSHYMIMSLEKYGAFKGLIKGLRRWARCKPPNGGVDLP